MNTDKNVSKAAKSVEFERICAQNFVLEVPVMERPQYAKKFEVQGLRRNND
jgi:hypothetical protein